MAESMRFTLDCCGYSWDQTAARSRMTCVMPAEQMSCYKMLACVTKTSLYGAIEAEALVQKESDMKKSGCVSSQGARKARCIKSTKW